MGQSKSDVGRSGEFLAAYILETHGVEVHHVDRAGADLWCRVGDTLVTVQVKSASIPRGSRPQDRSKRYPYHTKGLDADWVAFVALDRQLLLMRRSSEITVVKTWISPSEFNEANQRRTIEALLGG